MNKSVVLRGATVTLRPMRAADAKRYVQWLADPDVTTFLAIGDREAPPTLKEEKEWIAEARTKRDQLNLAIDTADGEHIGTISLKKIDPLHRHAEYGIFIGNTRYWGQGLGTEAGQLIVDYGFRTLKLNRIYLFLIAYNLRAQRSYERIGFKVEGTMRKHWFRKGHFHDRMVMGMLKEEWARRKKKK